MRVLMVSKLWPPRATGGAELYAAGLAEQLELRGHEVRAVTYGVDGPGVIGTVPTHGVVPDRWWESSPWRLRASHVMDLWNPETRRALRRAVDAFKPDVVHSHAIAGMSVAAMLAPPPVARVHQVNDLWLLCWRGTPIRNGVMCTSTCAQCVPYEVSRRRIVGRRPPMFIAPSQSVLDAHVAHGWDASRWRVIKNPVFAPATPRPARPTPTPPLRLGFIGQVHRNKGVDLLLDALGQLPTGTTLVAAGQGDLVAELVAHPQVDYRGPVSGDEKERFFDDIDVLIVPSRMHEAAGLIIDEAASRRVPVIASRRGGIPEYVPETCRDLLFDPDDVANLLAAIERFSADPAAFPAAAPTGRSWVENADRVLETYAEAIASSTASIPTA